MKRLSLALVLLIGFSTAVDAQWWRWGRPKTNTTVTPPGGGDPGELADLKLLHESDFTFDGGFCLPDPPSNGMYLNNAPSHGIAYRASTNTMFVTGAAGTGNSAAAVGELTIPTLVLSSNPLSLNVATFTATGGLTEPSEGGFTSAYTDPTAAANSSATGISVYNGTHLLFSTEYFYDTTPAQTKAYALRPLDLTDTGHVTAYKTFNGINDAAGFSVIRQMTMFSGTVPTEWQDALECVTYAGAGISYSIAENQSWGPSAFCINAETIGTGTAGTASPFVFYPPGHRELGDWNAAIIDQPYPEVFNSATQIRAGAMIGNSRTMLFFGVQATDNFCYGPAKSDPNDPLIGTPYPDPVLGPHHWCYDPTSPDSGNHGYPYTYFVWAYDLLDFKDVVDGVKDPWTLRPYDYWVQDFPVLVDPVTVRPVIRGASPDNTNGKLWLSQGSQFGAGCVGGKDVIWRISVNTTP